MVTLFVVTPLLVLLQSVYDETPPGMMPWNSVHPPLVAGPLSPLPRCHFPKDARAYGEACAVNTSGSASSESGRVLSVVGFPTPVRNG